MKLKRSLGCWAGHGLVLAALVIHSPSLIANPLLELKRERTSPFDLEVTGCLTDLPTRESRFVPHAEMLEVPTSKLDLDGVFVPGRQTVTVVFLDELLQHLPLTARADTVLARCADGYLSIYRRVDLPTMRPFVVLEINGQGPEHWPPPGLKYNPAPYVILVSTSVAPAVATLLDANHKRPWGVTSIELANFDERFHDAYSGAWSSLSSRAEAGRTIWINSCLSCHRGPGDIPGGTKADRPFQVIAAHAAYNAAYFRRYVRNPQGEISGAKMEPHPHYTDEQLDDLIAFITAEKP